LRATVTGKILVMKRSAAKANPVKKRLHTGLSHEVRIIGGVFKRTKLPVADKPGLRPTPDRVRETLFNWLGQDLTGWRCLDAFAGSGALGFEAASRGAKEVRLIERDAALVVQLQKVQTQLKAGGVQVLRGDGVAVLGQTPAHTLDLVLLDPPFDSDLFETALAFSAQVLAARGWVYLEAPTRWTDALLRPVGLAVHRYLRAGAVHAHLLMSVDATAEPDNDPVVHVTSCMP